MNAARLEELIVGGESFTVEFKGESRRPLSDRDLVEAVVCLANGAGGHLIIGVEDDGAVTGARARHEHGRTDPFRLQALVANRTVPPVQVTVTVQHVAAHPVVVVEVENAGRVVGTHAGLHVRRALQADGTPACVPFPAHEMLAHEIDRGAVDYARLRVAGATWSDLEPLEFERLRTMVKRAGPGGDRALGGLSDVDIAKALGVCGDGEGDQLVPLAGALLLFGRPESLRRFVPTHEAAFQVLRGTQVEVSEFLPGPLLRVADELFMRLQARNTEEELDAGLLRISLPRLPEPVVREAVANALVHRDYTLMGPVRVQLTEDALEVASPGGLPPGVRLDNLLTTQRPRSPLLADAFKRAGVVERTGRGINRMFETLLRLGRDAPDYTRTTERGVTAVVGLADADLSLARFVLEREKRTGIPLRLSDLQVLHELRREGRLGTRDVALLLQQTQTQARAALSRMVEQGLVDARGTGRGRTHHLSAAVHRTLDASSAYARARGFDRRQQEQMVLTYVQGHGRITRQEAADLCSISPDQASVLLRDLVRTDALVMRGERRWAHYVLAGDAEPS